jgi:ABC-2 type transport system permease protein
VSVAAVGRRDFLDVRRAKLVWAPVALYTAFMLLFFWGQSNSTDPNFYSVVWSLAGLGGALVLPLIALVAAYLSVAGERESGSIRFTLGLPVERSQVVLGKLLARSAVVAVGIVVSFAIGAVAARVLVPAMTVDYGDYVAFAGLTLLYALAYVAVAVAISSATASRSRAMAGGLGFFFLFNLVWNFLPVGPVQMLRFLGDQLGMTFSDTLLRFVFSLSPTGAYLNGLELVIPDAVFASRTGGLSETAQPFYVEGWFMLVILAFWVVVPTLLALWRFDRAQIG